MTWGSSADGRRPHKKAEVTMMTLFAGRGMLRSHVGGWSESILGRLFNIAIPNGKPIMVIFKNQARIIARPPSHHPMKMNHKAWMRQPGPDSFGITVEICDWDSIVMCLPYPKSYLLN